MTESRGGSEPAYPPRPWRLRGPFLVAVSAVALDRARAVLPAGVEPLPVAPGRTVGGVVLGLYGERSTLLYAELIAFPALVRRGARSGAWVSHVWVDSEASVAGGREIWALPKRRAEFDWRVERGGASVEVRRDGRRLLAAGVGIPRALLPVPAHAPVLGPVGGEVLFVVGAGLVRAGVTAAALDVPPESPLAPLGLDRPIAAFAGFADLRLGGGRIVARPDGPSAW